MRVLLDEWVPRRLRNELSDLHVSTVPEMGWASMDNGDLLRLASAHFDVFITTDQKLGYQHSHGNLAISVVTLIARRNKLEFLLPFVSELRRVITEVRPGELRRIGI